MLGPKRLLQSGFLIASCTILVVNAIPALRSRFINYGLRATPASGLLKGRDRKEGRTQNDSTTGHLLKLLDKIRCIQVPHGSFEHFYIISLLSSLLWGSQLLSHGGLLRIICQAARLENGSDKDMSIDQIVLCWSLLLLQGIRRLSESYLITNFSASRMWFVQWYLGVAFYLAIGIAVWIEGAGTILSITSVWQGVTFSAPSMRTLLCIPTFLLASGVQHDCHTYLASLPKYTLPLHPLFQNIICPHYTAECVIYASLAVVAAPPGAWVNKTLFCALTFVVVNLGVTASSSKEWYAQKFGRDKVEARWKLLPQIF